MKIGIPRAMGYYMYYPFWHAFFKELGIEAILSAPTTKKMVSAGSSLVVSETCLPIKVFVGHVLDLLDKGVDTIYVPSIQSIDHKIYNCSKIRGLPDLIRNVVKKDFLLVEPTLDKSDEKQDFYQYLYESVEPLGIKDKKLIKEASKAGWRVQNNFNLMLKAGVNLNDAIKYSIRGEVRLCDNDDRAYLINVGLVSHGYNIYDNHVSMRIFDKLEKMGVKVFAPENLTPEQRANGISMMNTELYWANEYEMTGAAGHYLNDNKIDGVISLTSFGCGPDSIMIERMTREAKKLAKPLLNLTIDEHTGEAGFITRLEAFIDMLFRKKRQQITKQLDWEYQESDKIQSNVDNERIV